jgi:ferritin
MRSSDKIIEAFNNQLGRELEASHAYISIAAYFDREALPRLAQFFYAQSAEEREHAMKFVKFIVDVEGGVEVPAVAAPSYEFADAVAAVSGALESERDVTRRIYELVEVAREEKDYMALRFLDWFIDEQREEEATMSSLLQVIQRAAPLPGGLLHVEDYLARTGGGPLESTAATEGA